jgi:choline dehydrogenase-like flavoprotein
LYISDLDEDIVTIPGLAGGAVGTRYDWNVSYAATEGLQGRKVPLPQGKVVGGSTKLNRMVFDRGSKSDYDGWEDLGNDGWKFTDLLPYFKKVCGSLVIKIQDLVLTALQNEKFTPPTKEIKAEYDIQENLEFHGDKGYMHSTYSPFFWPTTSEYT